MLTSLAAILIGVASVESTPPRPIAQLVHTRWTTKDGAPSGIQALAQTTDGYLWLGTSSGLIRFDGVRFVPLPPRGGDSVPTQPVQRLLATRDGSLWIVWRNGAVSRLRDGRLTSYGTQDGLPAAYQLAESSHGTLVVGTVKGVARFVGGKWEDVGREWGYPGSICRAVWFDRDDALWAETEDRVVYLPAGGRRFLDPGISLIGHADRADFAQAQDGTIWMSEVTRSAHTLRRMGDRNALTEVKVGASVVLIDREGTLWVASVGDGLRRVLDPARIRGRQVAEFGPEAEQFTMKDGLLSDLILALLEDKEGNIWIGSDRGLERLREGAFAPTATPGSARPRFVYAGRDTSVWTAALNRGELLRFGPRGVDTTNTSFSINDVAQDSSGIVWTIDGTNILRLQGHRFTKIRLGKSEAYKLSDITIDPAGTIWVFDDDLGLLRLTRDRLTRIAPVDEPVQYGYLFSDREGRIWIGQMNRVALYDHGQLSRFGEDKGVRPGVVRSFFEDGAGNVWVAGGGGLSKFEGGRFRTLSEHQGIPGGWVSGLATDEEGAWWVVTQAGVLRLPPGEVDRALADSGYSLRYRRFDQNDGLPGVVLPGYWGSVLTRAADGRIWVATDSGIASVDPRHIPRELTPTVLIEAVRIDGRELAPSDAMVVAARTSDLEIDYTATSFTAPERVQFHYQLEGEDQGWHDVGTRRRAYYSGLAPGAHRFRVIATNGDGAWSETGAAWNFRVLPAWYQTIWFKTGVVLLIGGVGAAAAGLVQRRRHRRAQDALKGQYEATLAERARIAQDLHDTLLQGFAGVTLQLKAAELALPEQPDVAAETILRVQRLARESLKEARNRVWDMRDSELASEDLSAALDSSARERTAGTGIVVSVVTTGSPRRLSRSLEDAAFRIGREAVANAVRHAHAHRIEIHLDFGAARLRLEVHDDGRGFTPEEGAEAGRNGHFGLTGMRDRATSAGGRCDVSPRSGGGTVVALELPLSEPRPQ